MSEPDGRYGSSAPTDAPLPGQPLADQPTEAVEPVRRDDPHDTVVGAVPARRSSTEEGAPAGKPDSRRHAARGGDDGASTRPDYRAAPVVVRRADNVAGLLLLLAGIAAGVSLLVVWVNGGGTGLDLVRTGLDDLGAPQRLADRGTWEPLAVVYGGAALLALGLLVFIPAKTHRLLGALALLVTLVVAAGVLVPLADAHWDLQRWAVGAWFTVAVGGLGFLGALKALMTGPKVGRRH